MSAESRLLIQSTCPSQPGSRIPGQKTFTIECRRKYGVHFYGGMILAAAERCACARTLSEDLNAGQSYFGIKLENPFG